MQGNFKRVALAAAILACGLGTAQADKIGGGSSSALGVGIGVGIGVGQGGAGGAGGAGGSAIVNGSGNSSNTIRSSNSNTNVNVNQSSSRSSVSNSGNSSSRSSAHQSQSQGQGQQQGQLQYSYSGGNSLGQANGQSVNVGGDTYQAARIPVATAYAPNIAPTAVCMGSTSVGGQGMTFGVSIGSSWTDKNCMLLEQVRTVAAVLGDKRVAAAMMCVVPAYAQARAAVGQPCDSSTPQASAAKPVALVEPQGSWTPAERAAQYNGTDPIVRRRLGLPPLAQR